MTKTWLSCANSKTRITLLFCNLFELVNRMSVSPLPNLFNISLMTHIYVYMLCPITRSSFNRLIFWFFARGISMAPYNITSIIRNYSCNTSMQFTSFNFITFMCITISIKCYSISWHSCFKSIYNIFRLITCAIWIIISFKMSNISLFFFSSFLSLLFTFLPFWYLFFLLFFLNRPDTFSVINKDCTRMIATFSNRFTIIWPNLTIKNFKCSMTKTWFTSTNCKAWISLFHTSLLELFYCIMLFPIN